MVIYDQSRVAWNIWRWVDDRSARTTPLIQNDEPIGRICHETYPFRVAMYVGALLEDMYGYLIRWVA